MAPITGTLGIISVAEAIARAATATRKCIIEPLVATEETSVLTSQPRDGKTWFMLAGCLAVANGEKLAGQFCTHQTNVLYCSNEDGERAVAHRVRMLMNAQGQEVAPAGFRLHVGRGLWLDDAQCQKRLIDEVRSHQIGLVAFDPLRSLTACVDRGPSELQHLPYFSDV